MQYELTVIKKLSSPVELNDGCDACLYPSDSIRKIEFVWNKPEQKIHMAS